MHSLTTPKPLSVSVNGVNISHNVVDINGAYSPYNEGSGLVFITGEMIIGEVPGTYLELDDRLNSLWSLGNMVRVTVAGQTAPIVGTTFIDSVQYSKRDRQLKIGLVCRLGLMNNANPGEIGACFRLGDKQKQPVGTAISELLGRIDVPVGVGIIGMQGDLHEIKWLDQGESLVSLAGKLAQETGHFLFQNKEGQVESESIIQYRSQPSVGSFTETELPTYDRLFSTELPPDQIKVQGDICDFAKELENKKSTTIVAVELGVQITTNSQEIDRVNRIITDITSVNMPRGTASPDLAPFDPSNIRNEKTETKSYYEKASREVGQNPDNCVPEDPGRLIRKVSRTVGWSKSIIPGWIIARKKAEEKYKNKIGEAIFSDTTGLFKKSVEDRWEYNLPKPKLLTNLSGNGGISSSGVNKVRHTRKTVETLGALLPALGNPYWGFKGTSTYAVRDPYSQVVTEVFEEIWTLREDNNTWDYETFTRQVLCRARPESVKEVEKDEKLQNKEGILLGLVSTEATLENNQQYSTGGQWSQDVRVECCPFNLKRGLAAPNPLAKNKTYNLGNKLRNAQTALDIGTALGRLEWARYKGQNIVIGLSELSSLNIRPFSRVTVSGTTYAMDGASIIIRPNEAAIQSDCVWISSSYSPSPGEDPVIITPIEPIPETTLYHDTEILNILATVALVRDEVSLGFTHDVEIWEPLAVAVVVENPLSSVILDEEGDSISLEDESGVLLLEDE